MNELRRNRDLVSEVLARAKSLTTAAANAQSPDSPLASQQAPQPRNNAADEDAPTGINALPTAVLQASLTLLTSANEVAQAAVACRALAEASRADYGAAWAPLCARHFGVGADYAQRATDVAIARYRRPMEVPVLAKGLGVTQYFADEVMDDLVDGGWVDMDDMECEEDEGEEAIVEDADGDQNAVGLAQSWRHVYRDRLHHWRQSLRQMAWLHAHGAPSHVNGRRHRYELYIAMRYAAHLTACGVGGTLAVCDRHASVDAGVDGYDGYAGLEAMSMADAKSADGCTPDATVPCGDWPHSTVVPLLRAGLVRNALNLFEAESPVLREQCVVAVANAVQYCDFVGVGLFDLSPPTATGNTDGGMPRLSLAVDVSRLLLKPGASPGAMLEAARLLLELGGCTVRVPSCELRRGLGPLAGAAVLTRLGTLFDDEGSDVVLTAGALDTASPEQDALAVFPWRFEIVACDGTRSPRPMACHLSFSEDGETAEWIGFEPTECAVGVSGASGVLGQWFHLYGSRVPYPGGVFEGTGVADANPAVGCWDFHGHYDGADGGTMKGAAISRRLASDALGLWGHELAVKGEGEPLLISGGVSRKRPRRAFRVWS